MVHSLCHGLQITFIAGNESHKTAGIWHVIYFGSEHNSIFFYILKFEFSWTQKLLFRYIVISMIHNEERKVQQCFSLYQKLYCTILVKKITDDL